MLGQPRVSGDATPPDELVPPTIPGPRADVRERRHGTSTDHAVNPPPRGPSDAIRQELMTHATPDQEHKQPSRQRGLFGFSGRLSHSPGGLGLCVSSRAPSRAGRSPYNSEPSIEATDSTTTSRRIFGETPAITHHPHQHAIPGRAPRPAFEAAGDPPPRHLPRPAGAQRAGCNGVGGGRCYRLRPWSPTQVTGRNLRLLRSRSRDSPATTPFSRSRGC